MTAGDFEKRIRDQLGMPPWTRRVVTVYCDGPGEPKHQRFAWQFIQFDNVPGVWHPLAERADGAPGRARAVLRHWADGRRDHEQVRLPTYGRGDRRDRPSWFVEVPEGVEDFRVQYRFDCARCPFNEKRYDDDAGHASAALNAVLERLADAGQNEIEVRSLVRLAWSRR